MPGQTVMGRLLRWVIGSPEREVETTKACPAMLDPRIRAWRLTQHESIRMSKSSVVSCNTCRDVRISCQLDGTRCRSHVDLNPTSKNQVLASSPPITQAIHNPTSMDALDTLFC
jgi:Na+-translocating ferredoxin:NAD+ oxidoreductase RnfC subunit